jgi:hypothetical protein
MKGVLLQILTGSFEQLGMHKHFVFPNCEHKQAAISLEDLAGYQLR